MRRNAISPAPPSRNRRLASTATGEFVVQKHAARRLHYDLRLELDGVLKSWAVTRGPSLTLGEKRLAVRTEDHPIEYLDFEGNIPKGEYGGGSMIVWDRGRWFPEGDPHKGLTKGHLAFTLDGARLRGLWHLVRIKPRAGEKTEPWLLIKAEDEFARHPGDPEITEEETDLAHQRPHQRGACGRGRAARRPQGARRAPASAARFSCPTSARLPARARACFPHSSSRAWHRPATSRRAGTNGSTRSSMTATASQARIDGGKVRLLTRNALDWTARFRGIADALAPLGLGSALIDGEIVVEDARRHFQPQPPAGGPAGRPTRPVPLLRVRSSLLRRLRPHQGDIARSQGPAGADHRRAPAGFADTPERASRGGRADHARPYLPVRASKASSPSARICRTGPGRGDHWFKAKCMQSQEFVILGYVPSTAASRRGRLAARSAIIPTAGSSMPAGSAPAGRPMWRDRCARSSTRSRPANRRCAKPLPAGAEKGRTSGPSRASSARSNIATGPATG